MNNNRLKYNLRFAFIPFFCLFMVFCGNSAAEESGAPGIVIQKKSMVTGDAVTLADISRLHLPAELASRLGKLRICASPGPGKVKKLSARGVLSIIRSKNLLPPGVSISAPDYLTVERSSQAIPHKELERLLYSQVMENGGEASLRDFKIRGPKALPTGKIELEPLPDSYRENRGKAEIRVKVRVDGGKAGKLWVSAKVDRYKMALCVTREISRGEIVTKEDLDLKQINMSKAPRGILLSSEEAEGKSAKRRIREGDFLRKSDIESPPLIRKGDRVNIVARSGALTVVASGVAKADGARGEQIRVKNISSKKTVTGRVVNPSLVEVLF